MFFCTEYPVALRCRSTRCSTDALVPYHPWNDYCRSWTPWIAALDCRDVARVLFSGTSYTRVYTSSVRSFDAAKSVCAEIELLGNRIRYRADVYSWCDGAEASRKTW